MDESKYYEKVASLSVTGIISSHLFSSDWCYIASFYFWKFACFPGYAESQVFLLLCRISTLILKKSKIPAKYLNKSLYSWFDVIINIHHTLEWLILHTFWSVWRNDSTELFIRLIEYIEKKCTVSLVIVSLEADKVCRWCICIVNFCLPPEI